MISVKRISILTTFTILLFLFFSFRLLEVPIGVTIDEAAFGYNASLLSETLHDENNRFLPIFVLSIQSQDWRQPVTQWYMTGFYKVFGRSLFNLKLTSITVAVMGTLLIFLLATRMLGIIYAVFASLIFITTPIVVMHSHLALDNIMPIPFILLWLLGVYSFGETKSLKSLILAGVSLGIGFYTYKGMRSAAPLWTILTVFYIFYSNTKKVHFTKFIKPIAVFLISVAPFFLIAPILDKKYAGAVFGNQPLEIKNLYDFIYYYLSNFDLSFLFIKGDVLAFHSTGKHGMLLLSTLPLFVIGLYQSIVQKNRFLIFLVVSFFVSPLFFGFIGSVHRASRIMFLVPLYCLIAAYGAYYLYKISKGFRAKMFLYSIILLMFVNFYNFITYYWYQYPADTKNIFHQTDIEMTYRNFLMESKKRNLTPYISKAIDKTPEAGDVELFLRSIYFPKPYLFSGKGSDLPTGAILLSDTPVQGLNKLNTDPKFGYLYTK